MKHCIFRQEVERALGKHVRDDARASLSDAIQAANNC